MATALETAKAALAEIEANWQIRDTPLKPMIQAEIRATDLRGTEAEQAIKYRDLSFSIRGIISRYYDENGMPA